MNKNAIARIMIVFVLVFVLMGGVTYSFLYLPKIGRDSGIESSPRDGIVALSEKDVILNKSRLEVLELMQRQTGTFDEKAHDYTEAAKKIEEILSSGKVKKGSNSEGNIKIDLAISIMNQGMAAPVVDNRKLIEGIQILRDGVAFNLNYDARTRSRALIRLGDFLYNHYDGRLPDIAQNIVFTGETFKPMLIVGDILGAIARIYKLAADTSPNPEAEYRAANIFGDDLLSNIELSVMERQIMLNKINEHMRRGNELIKDTTLFSTPGILLGSGGEDLLAKHQEGNAYLQRASALAKLHFLEPQQRSKQDKEEINILFEKSIQILSDTKTDIAGRFEMIARYNYAQWLVESYGSERLTQIQSVLRPIYTDSHSRKTISMLEFVTAEVHDPIHHNHYHRRGIIELARVSPEWKKWVMDYGWTETLLSEPLPQIIQFK